MPIETLITRLTIESNTMGSKMAGGKKKEFTNAGQRMRTADPAPPLLAVKAEKV